MRETPVEVHFLSRVSQLSVPHPNQADVANPVRLSPIAVQGLPGLSRPALGQEIDSRHA
jgi:hypothetical protein